MRFILRYKYGILQTKTQRIDINITSQTTTTQLLTSIEKRINKQHNKFILKYKKGKKYIRIIPGWLLYHYQLKQGLQLQIQQILSNQFQDKKYQYFNNKYLNNVLGFNQIKTNNNMDYVKQQSNRTTTQQQQQSAEFDVRKYLDELCQKMLKEIQKQNITGFKAIFEQYPNNVPQQYLSQINQKKIGLKDELGEKGWGAIHYAIFYKSNEIIDLLFQLDVDVNKPTSDGWLPIQLAIDLKSINLVDKLINYPGINLNLVTNRGSALHFAAKLGEKQILMKLLDKDIDITIKDYSGKSAYEVSLNEQCKKILKKHQQKKYTYNQYGKGNLPLSLTTIFRGTILKIKKPFMNLKQRYLLIDPFQGSMIRYQSQYDYPKKVIQIVSLSNIGTIKIIMDKQKSWFMKKQLFYFTIQQPTKQIYACKYRHIVQKWVSNLLLAIKFSKQLQKNPNLILQYKRNQMIIQDVQIDYIADNETIKKKKSINQFSFNKTISNINKSPDRPLNLTKNGKNSCQLILQRCSTQVNNNSCQLPITLQKKQQNHNHNNNNKNHNNKIQLNKSVHKQNGKPSSNAKPGKGKVNFSSFSIVKILGSGQFGKVFLAKHIESGKQYALKALKKKNLILQKQIKYAVMQANILKQSNNPFIINLHYAFQTLHYLYLALDYCTGRDLSFHLARQVVFPQNQARFYIAQLILAIQYLHQKKIIYRDLKPQNILLDGNGHIKLVDFGLSKQVNVGKIAKSFCGSPAYLSPEMLTKQGVGKQSDLYGIGAVLYQFLMGQPPYFSTDIKVLYINIQTAELVFPKNISNQAKDLITKLLQRNPTKRIGYSAIDEIKTHQFFKEINWQKLSKLQITPPKRQELQQQDESEEQLQYIQNKNKTKFTDIDYDDNTKDFNRFINFSFVREL